MLPTLADYTDPIPREIDQLWERRAELSDRDEQVSRAVFEAVELLDQGRARAAVLDADGRVQLVERSRRAILLAFQVLPMRSEGAGPAFWQDRLPAKTRFDRVRVVPGAIARWGSFLSPGVVLLPSMTNIGAWVGPDTMVDTWATVGTCAQVGARVHLAGGVGLGGVVEPAGATPVVVEDDTFVGSRSILVEGARIRAGAKLGAGSMLTSTTHVFDAETGAELPPGEAPAWSVCVPSTRVRSFPGGDFSRPCLLVLRRLPAGAVHSKLELTDILRSHGATL